MSFFQVFKKFLLWILVAFFAQAVPLLFLWLAHFLQFGVDSSWRSVFGYATVLVLAYGLFLGVYAEVVMEAVVENRLHDRWMLVAAVFVFIIVTGLMQTGFSMEAQAKINPPDALRDKMWSLIEIGMASFTIVVVSSLKTWMFVSLSRKMHSNAKRKES